MCRRVLQWKASVSYQLSILSSCEHCHGECCSYSFYYNCYSGVISYNIITSISFLVYCYHYYYCYPGYHVSVLSFFFFCLLLFIGPEGLRFRALGNFGGLGFAPGVRGRRIGSSGLFGGFGFRVRCMEFRIRRAWVWGLGLGEFLGCTCLVLSTVSPPLSTSPCRRSLNPKP